MEVLHLYPVQAVLRKYLDAYTMFTLCVKILGCEWYPEPARRSTVTGERVRPSQYSVQRDLSVVGDWDALCRHRTLSLDEMWMYRNHVNTRILATCSSRRKRARNRRPSVR